MPTALLDGQAEIRAGTDDALVIGDGTRFAWGEAGPSWWAAPEVVTSDSKRSGSDGYQPGRDLLGKHATTFIVTLLADNATELGGLIDQWKAASARAADDVVAVRMNVLGQTRQRFGRFRIPGDVQTELARKGHVAFGSALFEALDARTFGDELVTASTGRTIEGSGFLVPVTVPFSLGAGDLGVVTITNHGNRPAPWTARLDGPLAYPAITHQETGRRLSLALTANGGVNLATGEWLDVISATRAVLLNGVADRRSMLSIDSDWWELLPGDNTFQLDASSGVGMLTVAARDAWHS